MRYLSEMIGGLIILLLFVLFAGSPDISDSVRKYIDAQTALIECEVKAKNDK